MPVRSVSVAAVSFLAGAAVSLCATRALSRIRKRKQQQNATAAAAAEAHLWKVVEHSFTGALIYVMDTLKLWETLWSLGPVTTTKIASRTGYSERWLAELLAQATAAGFCRFDETTEEFLLREDYAALLRGPEVEKRSMAGMFQFLHGLVADRPDAVVKAATTGVGVDYDFGESVVEGIDRKNRNFFVHHMLEDIIEKVTVPQTGESLIHMLQRGVDVADIGCGCGMSTIVLAKKFPQSNFYAYEVSPKSLEILEGRVEQFCLENITVCNVAARTVGDGPCPGKESNMFSFVYSHDLLHDMTNPRALIKEVRGRLSSDGCWIVVDVDCASSLGENLAKANAALNYGFSCLLCLSCATSTPGGEGLGTMGLHSALARQWMHECGFNHFQELKIKSKPDNSCFVVGC